MSVQVKVVQHVHSSSDLKPNVELRVSGLPYPMPLTLVETNDLIAALSQAVVEAQK